MSATSVNQRSHVYKSFLRVAHCLHILGATSENKFSLRTSDNRELAAISPNSLRAPVEVEHRLFAYPSPLRDVNPNLHDISRLWNVFEKAQTVIRLNHIGFCYRVNSLEHERKLLVSEAGKHDWHVYEEPSVNEGLWIFIGDTKSWQSPLLEFIPVAETRNRWAAYWLPHIQIDLDTSLSEREVRNILRSVFGQKAHPHATVIDGVVYFISVWLGTIGGVNFELDVGTNARNTQYARQRILHRLI